MDKKSYKSPPPIDKNPHQPNNQATKNANDTYKSNLESALPPQSLAKILANKAKQNRASNPTIHPNFHALPAIVAGSAPSLKAIDYSRLPLEFEVFRCNQFYFEDKYYLGKQIKGYNLATISTSTTLSQVWSALNLLTRGEYEVDKIFLQDNHIWFGKVKECNEIYHTIDNLSHYANLSNLIDRAYNGSFSHNIAEFLEWSNLASIYYAHHITSGILSCALAVAMGYREIYIAGIDFYSGDSHYFTNMRTPNIARFTELFSECDSQGNYKSGMQWHKKVADIEALYFLQEAYSVKFYSLCESSPISELIPLAKKTNNTFTPQPKPKDYICDFLIPKKESFEFMQIQQMQQSQTNNNARFHKQKLKDNTLFMVIKDIVRLPNDIRHYIKGCKIAKEHKNQRIGGGGESFSKGR